MNIDVEKIREDLLQDTLGAFFIGGYGGAVIEGKNIKDMSSEEIVSLAIKHGLNLKKYQY